MERRKSPLLDGAGFRHAFFTRAGGVSEGPYASLNFSYSVGDETHRVDQNLALAEAALGLEAGKLLFASQVHGADVLRLEASAIRETTMILTADGMESEVATLGLGVRTADCIPVLLADPTTGRAAAVHAGWRGLVRGVIAATLRGWTKERGRLLAAIGPHISVRAFEVSNDVAKALRDCSPAKNPISRRPGRKPHVDLRAIARAQLQALGLGERNIDDVEGCTFSEPGTFFSYRRDGKIGGRHLSAIVPRASG